MIQLQPLVKHRFFYSVSYHFNKYQKAYGAIEKAKCTHTQWQTKNYVQIIYTTRSESDKRPRNSLLTFPDNNYRLCQGSAFRSCNKSTNKKKD